MSGPNTPMYIMIVEDDQVDAEQVKSEFLNFNTAFNFYVAPNGVEALNKLYGRQGRKKLDPLPQVIIVDLRMPKMNGNEFIKELRNDAMFSNIPVFVLTASYTSLDKLATEDLEVDHIVKPLRRQDVAKIYIRGLNLAGTDLHVI